MAETYPLKFGKYVLLKPMARGGMGAIFLAAAGEAGFQKFCVVKKVIAEKSDRAKANRFLDEAKVVLRLSHANLVPTFDAGEVDGEFFIAMELVEGKDLREIWNRCVRTRTRIPLDVALHVAREISRALAYVHSHADLKLVHRDVAPPNVLISYFGEVKLTDFGLARSVLKQENTAPGVVFGRASYLSPEQARGEIADARTDIYSLGIVLWELVTGNQYLQLANLDPATAMSLVRHPRVQPPSSKAPWITPNLDALLLRALAPDRDQRFQSAEEMRKALSEIIAQISPRADAERTADFLRGLYEAVPKEERDERDKLLAESAPLLAPPKPRQSNRMPVPLSLLESGSTQLQFPKEDESLGVDFTGRVIDNRYRVIRKIGEGGMGTVYAGEHVEIGKDVAIKILHPAYSTQQDLVERFRREARAASRIGHPHIIDVTDFGTTEDGCAYFVMEHLDGIDLADVLSHERRLAPQRACGIAIQICRALAAAHAAGVIHRDLKPENIFLVARDGQADFVKVLDFGIARSMGRARRLTNPGVAMGTPEYMAPEQAEGGAVDQRSDIFSVGALIYEMVSGSPPQMSRDKELIPPRGIKADVPEELDRIAVRALDPIPARRYQSMAQFEYDLAKSLYGRPRAVSEMLGLHDQERGVVPADERSYSDEALGGRAHPRADSPPPTSYASLPSSSQSSSSSSPWEEQRGVAAGGSGADTAARGSGGGWRYAGTFAALALVAVAAVPISRRLNWGAHGQTATASVPAAPAQPSEADRRAQRLRAGVADVERMLGSGFGFAQLPALQERLAGLRADGGTAITDTLATRARGLLVKAAEEELDRGQIEAGVAHYRIALALDAHGGGEAELVAALRTRAQSALSANRDTEAVRWAREAVALANGDPAAHALLGECLHALRQDDEAVTEYDKALTSRPDDPTFTHGLSVARHALATESGSAGATSKHEHGSHGRRSTATAAPVEALPAAPPEASPPPSEAPAEAPDRERPAARPDDRDDKPRDKTGDDKPRDKAGDDKPAPSAPAEPAPDKQQ
jgi:serine/threonine protein kinase